ncbi:MAG: YggU family protein [Rhodocyclaceae bacterium]|nr:YggU family protein [Rhodocyclaceae bacterium]
MTRWLDASGEGAVVLTLHIQPGAKTTGFAGRHGDALKLRLAAPPVDGKANAALIDFLADFCGVARRDVHLVSGQSSRAKRVRITGDVALLRARLATAG